MSEPNLKAVAAAVADARPVASARRFNDPAPGEPKGGVNPGDWTPGPLGLPNDCPVQPLGIAGSRAWFIDPIGQVQLLDPPYGKSHLLGLFAGRAGYLAWAWPRFAKGGGVDGYAAEDVAAALVQACFAKGPWNMVDKVRGRGAWLSASGDLILHTGTQLLITPLEGRPRTAACGEVDGYVYPTRPEIPGPLPGPSDGMEMPGKLLLEWLRSWQWARPEVDPVLLIGWIAASMFSGALPWRPSVYITGDKATGKSTLQTLVKGLLGEHLIQAADTTPAGIYQHVGQDALPVAVDELEGEADVRRQKGVLKLARLAASGALMLRGGDRHNPVEFQARSCFLFSSINTPPLEPQDLSRMALLRLSKLPIGQSAPALDPQKLAILGRTILRRMVDEWGRFSVTWDAFRAELAKSGMDGRGQDTFGTLLTCADMILYRGWNDERLTAATADGDLVPWHELMATRNMIEFEDAAENWRLCLGHLLSVPVEAWRNGSKATVGQKLEAYWLNDEDPGEVKKDLAQAGLTIVRHTGDSGRREAWLAVPNQSPLVRRLFEGSKWCGDMGAGVWAGALRQSPPGRIHEVGSCRVNGDKMRATLVSLEGLYGREGIMRLDDGA